MTPRQRLFAALNQEPVGPPPVWLLFPYHPLSCYVDVRAQAGYRDLFAASAGRCVMLDRRHFSGIPLFAAEVVSRAERADLPGGGWESRTELAYRGRTLTAVHREDAGGTFIKKLLETADDLEWYCSLPLTTDVETLTRALDTALPAYLREKAEFPSDYGAMMLDLGEPIGALYHYANLEEYAIWSLTHGELVEAFLRRLQERWLAIYQYTLERDLAEVYFLVGSELAAPPLVSRATFQRWIVPFAQELIALIHRYGKKAIQHYHGQIREILPDFLTMAPDALHTIEAPPIGNCTLTEAFQITGDRITLIGNIQYDDFRAFTPAQMRDAVHAVRAEAAGHPFILSPTAGPFDPVLTEAMQDNYLAFIDAGCG